MLRESFHFMTPLLKTLEDFVVRGGDEFGVPVDGVGGGGILKPRTKNFYSHLKSILV